VWHEIAPFAIEGAQEKGGLELGPALKINTVQAIRFSAHRHP
jgi:hypothetical protein